MAALVILMLSCSKEDRVEGKLEPQASSRQVFYATTEDHTTQNTPGSPNTKVYADENMQVLWNEDDRISIFNQSTYNYQYMFTGEDGDNYGSFEEIPVSGFISANPLNQVIAVYPYATTNKVNNAGNTVTMTLPAEQTYKEHSFGIGANTMIAVTENNFLAFKNACGYFSLRLYGDNVSIRRITIRGNNNEKIAGKASIAVSTSTVPITTMDNSATNAITLVCDPPVRIGATSENYTDFWFVIPPTTFSNGFTITVTDAYGDTFEKTTTRSFTITRNQMDWMNPLKVEPNPSSNKSNRLTIEMLEDGNLSWEGVSIYYDLNPQIEGYNQAKQLNEGITGLKAGDIVQFYVTTDVSTEIYANHPIQSTAQHIVYGNIQSIYYVDFESNFATTMVSQFQGLFAHDTGLVSAKYLILPMDLSNSIYYNMFFGCTSLTEAPVLPATTLALNCYDSMFRNCTSLTEAPELPATNLISGCYTEMFQGCTSLIKAPALPATTLAAACYYFMFEGCTSLEMAPELPASDIAFWDCYSFMFDGCTNLKYIKCYATKIYSLDAPNATGNWLRGVSETGDFWRISSTAWAEGTSGIPEGWTSHNLD